MIERLAQPDDAEALSTLGKETFVETFGHLYTPENLAAFLENHAPERWAEQLADPAYAIRVAEAEGRPIAYAKLGPPSLPFTPQGHPIELRQLYVLKPWHGCGLAARLMEWTIAEARARGADELYLSVFTDNHRARRFYERYGFEFVRTYAFMVGSHADEDHIMRLAL
ncbi:MAG: GNAT family N-acetyltransferase [Sphingomonas sp.]|uniref:GNAT family N-acetyltransferase n=1 Tax=Sphingomonas sp. TaxID=28214 RepID=UPI0025DB80FB|nr:GNAT family N-acetyltransferase [Sphingomonas sp.]MBX9881444.1 GNAT family N-acetyltransferase [Sphingomonas sp.]